MKHCDNHADRMHFSGSDGAVFKAHHELIEEIASEVYELKDLLTPTVASLSPPKARGLARGMRSA